MIREAFLDAVALVFPGSCAGCDTEGRAVCATCRARLVPDVVARALPDGTPVWSGLAYEGVPRRVILALKEEGRTGLAAALAPALLAAVAVAQLTGARPAGAVLCPIPSSRRSSRRRGYDPVRLLLDRSGLSYARLFRAPNPLVLQKSLDREHRATNRADAFALSRPVDGLRVVVVDDVVTTGATLAAAVQVLRAGGAEVIGAVAVASTPRRHGRPSSVALESAEFL